MRSTYKNHKVILLDNSSIDGSVEAVRENYPDVQILKLEKNLGYAGNNNVGIEEAVKQRADWVFVLNEDTVLTEDCISLIVSTAEDDPTIGILGPLVYHYSEPEIIQTAGGMMDKYYRSWHLGVDEPDCGQFSQPREVDWISGCAIMVRREVIEQIGMIDERFFYYFEEFEWCVRAKKAGWKIIIAPAAKIWHKGVTRNHQPKPSVTYYATRNRLLTLLKHHAPLWAWIVTWGQLFRTLASWTLRPKWRNKREHRNAMWRGMVDFLHSRWGKMQS
jgi:GT2 family glycosyltransferase